MFDGFYKEDKIFSILRYVLPIILIFFYAIKYNLLQKLDALFVGLLIYLSILWIFNSGDEVITSRNMLTLVITLMMIPIGIHLGNNSEFIIEFEKFNRVILICIPLYIVYANFIGISGFYSDSFSTGFLVTSRMYVVPIVVFLAIHYAISNNDKSWILKTVDIAFILINICILLLNTRRTTFAILAGAIIVYTMFNKRLFFKMLLMIVVLTTALIISFPLYEERLMGQLEQREKIQNLDMYEEEGRVLETKYLLDYHETNRDIGEILFGIRLFDSYDWGTSYFGRDRPIHSDINMIFFSTGLVGILLFCWFFRHYFFRQNSLISFSNKILFYPLLIIFLVVLIPGRFIGTLTYAPLLMLLMSALKFGGQLPESSLDDEEEMEVSIDKA